MIPGAEDYGLPPQIQIYSRGSQGTGALPTAGQTITIPMFGPGSILLNSYLNPADNTTRNGALSQLTHGLRRTCGLWWVDIFLFQDQPATITLRERTTDLFTQSTAGLTDTTRLVWTRLVRASVAFKHTFRLHDMECRLVYVNGATNTTIHDFNINARAA